MYYLQFLSVGAYTLCMIFLTIDRCSSHRCCPRIDVNIDSKNRQRRWKKKKIEIVTHVTWVSIVTLPSPSPSIDNHQSFFLSSLTMLRLQIKVINVDAWTKLAEWATTNGNKNSFILYNYQLKKVCTNRQYYNEYMYSFAPPFSRYLTLRWSYQNRCLRLAL